MSPGSTCISREGDPLSPSLPMSPPLLLLLGMAMEMITKGSVNINEKRKSFLYLAVSCSCWRSIRSESKKEPIKLRRH